MRFMSGNLCYQIEHHLYPDLPSNAAARDPVRVREVCDKYDLLYTTGSFLMQYEQDVAHHRQTVAAGPLPADTADDAPETRSELMFAELEPGFAGTDQLTGRRRGLKTAITAVREMASRSACRRRHGPYGTVGYGSVGEKSGERFHDVVPAGRKQRWMEAGWRERDELSRSAR